MSAKEMFEKLGYTQYSNTSFCKPIENTLFQYRMFTFLKTQKFFLFTDDSNNVRITLEELQAINKQVEELCWYE